VPDILRSAETTQTEIAPLNFSFDGGEAKRANAVAGALTCPDWNQIGPSRPKMAESAFFHALISPVGLCSSGMEYSLHALVGRSLLAATELPGRP
jgi:hypothetical protein